MTGTLLAKDVTVITERVNKIGYKVIFKGDQSIIVRRSKVFGRLVPEGILSNQQENHYIRMCKLGLISYYKFASLPEAHYIVTALEGLEKYDNPAKCTR